MNQDRRRTEAVPLAWGSLSENQKQAVESVTGWLLDAREAIPSTEAAAETHRSRSGVPKPVLDFNRRSQLAFIDGDRGTGKSSILLTLMELTSTADASGPLPKPVELLNRKRDSFVWLEVLDMEPLAQGANLFAATLARLDQLLSSGTEDMPPLAAALGNHDGYADTASKLHQLQNDAAIVWERVDGGNYGGDLQAKALSVMQAEKAGLELHRRFSGVMDGIGHILQPRTSRDPLLFLLPVDDFDLAPAHCLDLLRLIRMVTTPRLFFVLAGNTRIAESVLRLKSEGELMKLAGFNTSDPNIVLQHATEIAANNMRKLLPPGQQVRLEQLRLEEALDFRNQDEEASIRGKLGSLHIEMNQAPKSAPSISLAEFLLVGIPPLGNSTSAEWLAATPRQVLDVRELLSRLDQENLENSPEDDRYDRDDRLVVTLLQELQDQITEDWRIPFALRVKLSEILDTETTISIDLENVLRVDEMTNRGSLLKSFDHGNVWDYVPQRTRVFVVDDTFEDSVRQREQRLELPRRLAAGMLFAHDLMVALWGGYLRHSSLTYGTRPGPWVRADWATGSDRELIVSWPKPQWWTFRDYERFTQHWRFHQAQCDGRFGAAWITAILEVVQHEPCQPGEIELSESRLSGLLDDLISEEPTRTARVLLRKTALSAIALMMAPEYESGVQLDDLGSTQSVFLSAIDLDAEIHQRIRDARARTLSTISQREALQTPGGAALCSAISPQYAWKLALQTEHNIMGMLESSENAQVRDEIANEFRKIYKTTNMKTNRNSQSALRYIKKIRSMSNEIESDLSTFQNISSCLDVFDTIAKSAEKKQLFNQLLNGTFVPSEQDAQRVR